ncbi:MAG: protein kinase [Deltaproteobacteria bacterium]|nr:protein kinase [Deltaproteobacteria bacterium]
MTGKTEQAPPGVFSTAVVPEPANGIEKSLQEKVDAIDVPDDTDMIGTLVDDKYELLEQLGEGGMGHVFRARHVMMGKEFAVKLIHAELAQVNEIVKRFQREARSSSLLNHPNCITVTDFGAYGEGNVRQLYLVMELLEGEDLDYRLHRQKRLSPELAVNIVIQVLKGLGHAHEQGVIHRDLKPENIFLVPQAEGGYLVKILDFGIAKMADGQSDGDKLTKTGVVFGTPKYLSPEQALGDQIDYRADLYSVGVILFEMLTGEPPFTGKTVMDVMSAHLTAMPPKLQRYGSYPTGLQHIVQKAMAKKPNQRYESAAEFIKSLEQIDYSDTTDPTIVTTHIAHVRFLGRMKTALFGSIRRRVISLVLVAIGLVAAVIGMSVAPADHDISRLLSEKDEPSDVGVLVPEVKDEEIGTILGTAAALLKKNEFEAAESACRKALYVDPKNPATKVMYGHVLYASGKQLAAIYQYQQAIDIDPRQGQNRTLRANLMEGLQYEAIRKKAALMLASYGTSEDLSQLTDLASSALTNGDVRRAVRMALERTANDGNVDWLTSLQADFREQKGCKERNAILSQIVQTKNPAFLPFLEKFEIKGRQKTRQKHPNLCIQNSLLYTMKMLARNTDTDTVEKESDSQ